MSNRLSITHLGCLCILFTILIPSLLQGQTEKQLFKRGLERMEIGNFEMAEIDFSMVIQLNHDNEVAYYNRGYCRLRLEAFLGAVEDFTESIEMDQDNYEAFFNRGNALRHIAGDIKSTENLEAARRVYMQALEDMNFAIAHDRKEARYLRGRSQVKMGLDDVRGAIEDLNLAVRLTRGKDPRYLFDRAEAFLAMRDFYEAMDDIDRIIELSPRNPEGYMFRAAVKLQAGDQSGACLDWSKAGELGEISAYDYIRENCDRY